MAMGEHRATVESEGNSTELGEEGGGRGPEGWGVALQGPLGWRGHCPGALV